MGTYVVDRWQGIIENIHVYFSDVYIMELGIFLLDVSWRNIFVFHFFGRGDGEPEREKV